MRSLRPATDYWVFRLRLPVLLSILKRSGPGPVGRLAYIHSTRIASLLLALCSRLKLFRFTVHQIQSRSSPAGPVLHLSEVRDDEGRVITLDVYRSVLEISGAILADLLKGFESFPFIRKERSLRMLEAWLRLKIAVEINPIVYLSYYSLRKHDSPETREKGKNILILPRFWWINHLKERIRKERPDGEIQITGNGRFFLKEAMTVFCGVIRALVFIVSGRIGGAGPETNAADRKKHRILIPYFLGVKKSARNDIPFAHALDFDLSRLVFVFSSPAGFPGSDDSLWLKEKGISCFLDPEIIDTGGEIPLWRPTRRHREEMALFGRAYLKYAARVLKDGKKYSLWLLYHFWELGKKMSVWKDFFVSNNVGISVFSLPSARQFLMSLALSEVGGIAVEMEGSILFDYCTYLHNSPCHVKFVTGPYSLAQIPEPSYGQLRLESGSIHVLKNNTERMENLTEKIKGRIGLALFDELPNDWFFGNSIRELYEAAIRLVREDSRFFLIVKTKKPQVMERLKDIKAVLLGLQQEGKCALLDWKTSVAAAASSSNLAVSVPSTAAFESVLSRIPTLLYNPMHVGARLFYRNDGLNSRVFEDTQGLTAALKRFADGDSSIGDCRELVSEIDAFHDGRGAERIGGFIAKCLQGLDGGRCQEDILNEASAWYLRTWGRADCR